MDLHHVLTRAAWAQAQRAGTYAPPALTRDGFLHCCRPSQLRFVLSRHFAGASDLLVLTFDADDMTAPLRWVASEPDQDPFPHLYGPIPCTAIRRVAPVDAGAGAA